MLRALFVVFIFSTQAWAEWSVSTYNVRNFDQDSGGATDHQELAKLIRSVKSDVMAFEEVVNVSAFKALIKKALPGYGIRVSDCGGFGNQNLALAYNPKTFTFVSEAEDLSFSGGSNGSCGSLRPLFLVTLAHAASKERYVFGVAHLKAGGDRRSMGKRWQQYKKLQSVARSLKERNLFFLGDLNTTGYTPRDEDFDRFEEFLSKSRMRSVSEELECTSYWHGGRGTREHWPSVLDHIVVPEGHMDSVKEIKLGAHCAEQECRPASPEELGPSYQNVSDHCPVQVTFN